MAAVTELELPRFDYTDPELRGERYRRAMRDLEGRGWLAEGPLGFVVLDREAGEFFLRTKAAVFPGLTIAELFEIVDGPLHEEIVRNVININGDDHRRLRNLVNPALSPRASEAHRPAMRGFMGELLDDLPPDGRCEFVEAVAKPYPSLLIAHVLGAPLGDAPRLWEWSNWIQRQFDAASLTTEREPIERAVVEVYEYLDELLAARRQEPGDDVISALLAAEDGGDRLSDVECKNLVLDLILGGIDTAQSQLAQAVRLFAEHPDQWGLLRERPAELAPAAVEEALRHEPVTPFTARITVEPVEYRDVAFPPGTVLMVSAWHANRDLGEQGGDPEAFDIAADRGKARPLTFGAGTHYCVGANLARLELQEALAVLAERVERIELDGEPEYGTITGIYGLDALPVKLAAAP
jgi:cytochrome P450